MVNRSTFNELLRCARDAGIEVRHAPLGGSGGGLANVRGSLKLFVDTDAEPEDQLDKTIAALRNMPAVLALATRADIQRLLSEDSAG